MAVQSNAPTLTPEILGQLAYAPLQPQKSGPAGLDSQVSAKINQSWPQAEVLAHASTLPTGSGLRRQVVIFDPQELPYRIRLEQIISQTPDGTELVVREQEMVADHVLVQVAADQNADALAATLAPFGLEPGLKISKRGLWRVTLPDPLDLDAMPQVLKKLNENPAAVRFSEADFIVRTLTTPNDTRYLDGSLWGLHNTGQDGGTADADIDAPEGWTVRNDASTVVVGVIDTGIRATHQDLAANIWVNPGESGNGKETNGIDDDGNGFIDDVHGINSILLNGNPDDDQGHGSHVAGTIGGVGNNGVGVTGVAWNVRLMGLKFLAAAGGGAVSDAIACIDYGVEHGADILSNSWGGGGFSQALLDAIEASRDAGVLFVVAAGNSGTDNDAIPVYPAALPVDNIVTVASTTRTDDISDFSCYGQGTVNIGAPGSTILSVGHASDTAYVTMSGTSMATPHVSGALALLRAQFPGDTWDQLVHRLYRGGDSIPSLANGKISTGRRLNIHSALTTTSNRPVNDDFADGRTIYGDQAVLRVNLRSATAESGEPALVGEATPNTLWYRFTPSASGLTSVTALAGQTQIPMDGIPITINYDVIPAIFGVYTGSSVNALTQVASGADALSFTATAGVTYHIAVAGLNGAEGLVMLDVTGAPANSTLANATSLDLNSSRFGTNRNALPEPGEPAHAGQTAAATVWYKWTANFTSRVAFSTRGSEFDTLAAVYSGPATNPTFASLVPVASNDNATSTTATFSRVEFQAIAGTTYYFVIDGKNGATGDIAATLALPPANDNFENAFILSGTDTTRAITTAFASREAGEPIHWPNAGTGESVWVTWTAPETGRTTLDLSGSFFRGIIAVYTGNAVDSLSLVARDGAGNRFAQVTFDATQGTTYRIAVDAWDFPLNNAPLRLRMVPTPANDTFAAATEMQGLGVTITGSNVGATREAGEPSANYNGGPSVWYRWTAPATGTYGLYGERLNKPDQWIVVLNVFTGTAVNALTHIKEDQQNGIGRDAFARFDATAGTTYYFQVTGLDSTGVIGGVGPFRLDLRPIAEHAPANDSFANAIELDGSPVFNFRAANYGASAEPGEPNHSTYVPFRSIWWKFTVPPGQAGQYAVATTLSEGDTGTTIYRANDPANPTLGALTQVASSVEFANQNFPDVKWQADEGQVYYIVTDNYGGALGRVVFNFQKVPANITFANAKVIPAEGLEEITYNYGSLREVGEPTTNFSPATAGNRSLWWRWTAPASGLYSVDTIGSRIGVAEDRVISAQFGSSTILGLDTVLGVYTGSLGSFTAVATNSRIAAYSSSNWSFQRNSRVEFNAVAGTTYHIMVNAHAEGQNEAEREQNTHQGEIHFRLAPLTPPANDAFANATEITGTEYRTAVSTYGATKEGGEPNHGGINGGRSLWWKWTAPESGPFIVSTAGNLFDDYNARRTGLGVYTGSAVNALTTVGSNQNAAGINTGDATWSAVQFNAVAGTTYYFGADAVYAGNLSFILTRPAANDNFANATIMQGSRWATTGHNLLTTVEPGEAKIEEFFNPPPVNNSTVRSVWWRWTAPVSGTITIDTLGSEVYNVMGVYTGASLGALTPIVTTPYSGSGVLNGEGPNRQRSSNKQVTFEATAGTTYHITVQGAGYTDASSGPITIALEGPPAVPFAPEDFTALRTGPSLIELDWIDAAVDEEFYEIQRSNDGVNWAPLTELGPDSNAFDDFNTPQGADYYYRVRAVNSVGQSAWVSTAVTVPQPPATPANLTVNALSASDLQITWDAPPTAESQRLERSSDGPSGPWTVIALNLSGTASSYIDTGRNPATTYDYRLRATNTLGHSAWAAASGTTQAAGTYTITLPADMGETAGNFQATVTRTVTSGSQVVFLSSNDARLSLPATVTIPDGQNSVNFTVTVADDAIINPNDIGTITAFAPAALIGESFTGAVDSPVNTQNTGWGWGAGWYSSNTPAVLVEPSLAYTKNGTISSAGTRAIRLNSSGGSDARRNFATKYTSGDVWVSTLLHRNSSNWGTLMTIRENTSGGINASVKYENNTNYWRLITSTGSNEPLLASNPSGQVLFIVMHFDFANQQIHAWLNPDVSGTTPTNALGSATVPMPAGLTGISRLDLFGYSTLDGFDEVRVATSFANLYGGITATRAIRILDDEAPAPSLTPREQWWLEKFGLTQTTGFAAFDADPNGNGLSNLLEYALANGNPLTPGTTILPQVGTTTIAENNYLTLTVPKNPGATDVTYIVETSTDLSTWQSGEGNTVIVSETASELVVRTTAAISDAPRRFLRLRVQITP